MPWCFKCGAETEPQNGVPVCIDCSKYSLERARILETLHHNREIARKQRDEAAARFDETIRHVPNGTPYSDIQEQIRRASQDYTRAQRSLVEATARLNDYLIDGTIPHELRKG